MKINEKFCYGKKKKKTVKMEMNSNKLMSLE